MMSPRPFLFAVLLGGFALAGRAEALDFCAVAAEAASPGTVESVREVPVPRDLHAFDGAALEHKLRPETVEELVVRLDVGPVVVFTQRDSHRLRAGQRVRVTLNGSIARVAPASEECSTPLASGMRAQRVF
jgi:hypothetical protein